MNKDKLLDDINVGLQALVREEIAFPVAEELPPLQVPQDFAWARENIQPPGAYYLSRDQTIVVRINNLFATATLTATGQLLSPDGRILLIQRSIVPNTNGTLSTLSFTGLNGMLLSFTVSTNIDAAFIPGLCYVHADIVSNDPSSPLISSLLAGYVSNDFPLVWPNGRRMQPGEGTGNLLLQVGANPGAGNQFSTTVPDNQRWYLRSLTMTLTNGAAVANRRFVLGFTLAGQNIWLQAAAVLLTAGQAAAYFYGQGAVSDSAGAVNLYNYEIPPFLLGPGWIIQTLVQNLQAADTLTAIYINIEQWAMP